MTLTWIKAHHGHDGNELADEYAKLGTIDSSNYEFSMTTKTEIKRIIEEKSLHYWEEKWINLKTMQTNQELLPLTKSKNIQHDQKTIPLKPKRTDSDCDRTKQSELSNQ